MHQTSYPNTDTKQNFRFEHLATAESSKVHTFSILLMVSLASVAVFSGLALLAPCYPTRFCPFMLSAFFLSSSVGFGVLYHHTFYAAKPLQIGAQDTDTTSYILPQSQLIMQVHETSETIPSDAWKALVPENNTFLSLPYLHALEQAPPDGMTPRYVMLYQAQQPVAAVYAQLLTLSPGEQGNDVDASLLFKVMQPLQNFPYVSKEPAPVRLLLNGNALLSGEHGFAHDASLAPQKAFAALAEAMQQLQKHERRQSGPIALIAAKDFSCTHTPQAATLQEHGYHQLTAEPAMIVHLREEWNTMQDYADAMSSKYRKRLRSARKKGKALERHDLSVTDLQERLPAIEQLFEAVLDEAGFRLACLRPSSFVQLKQALGEDFRVRAYDLDGQMVGFAVTVLGPDEVDGHLVGIDYNVNQSHAVYQNMLYDFVETGILEGKQSVHLGRTALEIKSTIGAEPEELQFYIRHTNPVANQVLKPFVSLVPEKEWTQRRPFKDQTS